MTNESTSYVPFDDLIEHVRRNLVCDWSLINSRFVGALESFDTEYVQGGRDTASEATRARFFAGVVKALLENASGKDVRERVKKESRLFGLLDLDLCHESGAGEPLVTGDVTALGMPPHPDIENTARPGSADLYDRARQVAFTCIDLKSMYSPLAAIRSIEDWVTKTSPDYFSFWAVRSDGQSDFETIRRILVNLRAYASGVGAVIYEAPDPGAPTKYRIIETHELSMKTAIRDMAQRIRASI